MPHFGLIHTRPAPREGDGEHLPDDHVQVVTRHLAGCVGRLLHEGGPGIGSCRHVADDDGHDPAVTDLLSTCRVVVVLGSDVYDRSPVRRRVEASARPVVVIDWVSPAGQAVGFVSPGAPGRERNRKGLYELFLGRNAGDAAMREYRARLDEHAAEIVARARDRDRPRSRRPAATAAPRHLRADLYLLAPTLDRLPGDRDPHQYGATSLDWHPYRRAHERPLRWHLEAWLHTQRFQPVVVAAFDDGIPTLLDRERPQGPSVLVLDPWALDDGDWRDALRRFDSRHQPWVGVVVAWDLDDPQTGAQRLRLRLQLGDTLRQRFERRRPALRAGAPVATDLLSLQGAFSTVVEHAAGQFSRYHPPPGPLEAP